MVVRGGHDLRRGRVGSQFHAELAFEPGFPINYDADLTAISFLAVIGTVWLGMSIVHRCAGLEEGGAMIAAGIAAMHYIGRAAWRAPAQLHWDAGYVLVSIAIAMTFAAAAMRVLGDRPCGPPHGRGAAHPGDCQTSYHGHGGGHFRARSAYRGARHAIAPNVLAIAIATVIVLIAALGLPGVTVDNYLAERLRRSADRLARAQRIAHTGSIEQDLRTCVIEWSGETYRIFRLDPNLPAPAGDAFLGLFHPDDRAACETQGPATARRMQASHAAR